MAGHTRADDEEEEEEAQDGHSKGDTERDTASADDDDDEEEEEDFTSPLDMLQVREGSDTGQRAGGIETSRFYYFYSNLT